MKGEKRAYIICHILASINGKITGSFADFIDELSLVIVPVTECGGNNPTVFESMKGNQPGSTSQGWKLSEVKTMENSVVWMRYRKE